MGHTSKNYNKRIFWIFPLWQTPVELLGMRRRHIGAVNLDLTNEGPAQREASHRRAKRVPLDELA